MNQALLKDRSAQVKKIALSLGFDLCGISKAAYLENETPRLEKWLGENRHGEMAYMARHFDKRLDPAKLVEGARSVISLVHNYFPKKDIFSGRKYKIARYAYGADYHNVIRKKLEKFVLAIREQIGEVNGRVFVDSAPVMERQWAAQAGLGWTGKNTLLLNPAMGSYFFLSEFITDLELDPDAPIQDHCGTCTRCIDACPTGALTPYQIDARKCISYLTIELKGPIPDEFRDKYNEWIFGCDICQEVCPWNRFSKPHREPELDPVPEIESFSDADWIEITADVFRKLFKKSPLQRAKLEGIKRNIEFLREEKS
jgi:epoxyqueuosine reductase